MEVDVQEEDILGHQPAVVLRSQYSLGRVLLVITTIAVLALTVAVTILLNTGNEATGMSATEPIPSIDYGGFNPGTGRPESAPLPR